MNSVTAFNRLPQLRAIPVPGTRLFRYEIRIANRWISCNHSAAYVAVGIYLRGMKRLCEKLTADSGTAGVSPSVLSAGNRKVIALSICGLATPMSVSAHSTFSNVISGK